MTKTVKLCTVPEGEIFRIGNAEIGEFEFIKFSEENGITTVVSKNCMYNSRFGRNNNFSRSEILDRLQREVLPLIEVIVGEGNVFEFETDLFSLDGSRKHGVVKSKISIPTLDFYRENRAVFERYRTKRFWWLATPDSTSEYYNDNYMLCVAPSGIITSSNKYYGDEDGVRAVLHIAASIPVEITSEGECEDD